jgi:hypothetical protein
LANALLVSNVSPDIGINRLPLKNDRESEFQGGKPEYTLKLFPRLSLLCVSLSFMRGLIGMVTRPTSTLGHSVPFDIFRLNRDFSC